MQLVQVWADPRRQIDSQIVPAETQTEPALRATVPWKVKNPQRESEEDFLTRCSADWSIFNRPLFYIFTCTPVLHTWARHRHHHIRHFLISLIIYHNNCIILNIECLLFNLLNLVWCYLTARRCCHHVVEAEHAGRPQWPLCSPDLNLYMINHLFKGACKQSRLPLASCKRRYSTAQCSQAVWRGLGHFKD